MFKKKLKMRLLLVALNIWCWLDDYSLKKAKQCLDDSDWFMHNADEAFENQLIIIAELKEMNEE